MTHSEFSDQPAFQNLESEATQDHAPLSRVAVGALVLGIVSLVTPLTSILLPISIMATGVGCVAVLMTTRNPGVRGTWLAQIGLALGVLTGIWSTTATGGYHQYLYNEAGTHAKHFLQTLSAGDKYEALELMVNEGERQIAGTDLSNYYQRKTGPEQTNVQKFVTADTTREVMAAGADANWQFTRGVQIEFDSNVTYATVEMVNQSSARKGLAVLVKMQRHTDLIIEEEGIPTALWNVSSMDFDR